MARTRAVVSYDPATLASAAAELPGREFLQAM
ncbi:MAG: aromatic compound degradation protein PaaI, partial [Solirubrobacterales bacterium]|nr:aromatic compound degradation protein PaaI [Solirubrobacterales bacterium]